MLESGQGILQYLTKHPFRLSVGEQVGLSGIIFEEAQWGLMHEWRKHAIVAESLLEPFYWYGRGTSGSYEPRPSGLNLGSGSNKDAEATYTNYIEMMRRYLSGPDKPQFINYSIFSGISKDSDYSWAEIKNDYHKLYFSGITPSGRIAGIGNSVYNSGDFTYPFYDESGLPPQNSSTFLGYLGSSGSLLDVDFAEVMYKPYPRFAKTLISGIMGPFLIFGIPFGMINSNTYSPIFPRFCKTNGSLVTPNSRDIAISNPVSNDPNRYTSQAHISSGYVRVDGDILQSGTNLVIGNTTCNWKGSGTRKISEINNSIYFNGLNAGHIPGSRAFYSIPSITSGMYKVSLNNPSIFNNGSGVISSWFKENLTSSGFDQTATRQKPFHVTNSLLWAGFNSGIQGFTPDNGDFVWTSLADQTPGISGLTWTGASLGGVGTNYLVFGDPLNTVAISGFLTDIDGVNPSGTLNVIFNLYDSSLNLLTSTQISTPRIIEIDRVLLPSERHYYKINGIGQFGNSNIACTFTPENPTFPLAIPTFQYIFEFTTGGVYVGAYKGEAAIREPIVQGTVLASIGNDGSSDYGIYGTDNIIQNVTAGPNIAPISRILEVGEGTGTFTSGLIKPIISGPGQTTSIFSMFPKGAQVWMGDKMVHEISSGWLVDNNLGNGGTQIRNNLNY